MMKCFLIATLKIFSHRCDRLTQRKGKSYRTIVRGKLSLNICICCTGISYSSKFFINELKKGNHFIDFPFIK